MQYWSYDTMRARVTEGKAVHRCFSFDNNIDSLKSVFQRAESFMLKHGMEQSARQFLLAQRILDGREVSHTNRFVACPELPEDKLRIYNACVEADVFDLRNNIVRELHKLHYDEACRHDEEKLRYDLLTEIRAALLYAINA